MFCCFDFIKYESFKFVIDYMKLDSQLNVQFAHSQELAAKEHRSFVDSRHSQALYHSYLQLYEENLVQSREYQKIDEQQTDNQSKNELYVSKHAKEYVAQLDILEQNRILKEQLQQVYVMVGCLQNQLSRCKQELDRMRRINQDNQLRMGWKHEYILQELQALLQNNSLLDQEVEYLKSHINNGIKPIQINSCYLKSKPKQYSTQPKAQTIKQNNWKNNRSQTRQKQFIKSIQTMYQSITGKIQTKLVVIWRWLKQITLSYSKFAKWKRNNLAKIATAHLQPLLAMSLLNELKFIN